MYTARLSGPTDVAGWRAAARRLRLADAAPQTVRWLVAGEGDLFAEERLPPPAAGAFVAPKALVDLAEEALLNRAPDRFDLLYRLLWRARDEPHLLGRRADQEVARAFDYQHQTRRAEHHLHAFVRFRRVKTGAAGEPEAYAAWIDPPHFVIEKAAPFFIRRLANVRFSIASPYVRVAWDGEALTRHPGVPRSDIPETDACEDDWRAYYAATFNPARLNASLMTQHMPRHYWRGLPEADAIAALVAEAPRRAATMVAAAPSPPTVLAERLAARQLEPAAAPACPTSLDELRAAVLGCRRCPLHHNTTQAVPGEGAPDAPLMIVGEQPGDLEDLRGRPFVGPAGEVLAGALRDAGVVRDQVWLTNAVKHFKHERRGKRRLHKTPDPQDIAACGDWLAIERRLVKPRVVLALGATAARALAGRPVAIGRARGEAFTLADGAAMIPTYHPAYILRLPDGGDRDKARQALVTDLALAAATA